MLTLPSQTPEGPRIAPFQSCAECAVLLPYMFICATVILKLFHSRSLPTMHLRNGAVEGLERMSAEGWVCLHKEAVLRAADRMWWSLLDLCSAPPSLCRFVQYESFDSRSASLGPRDLYRSGSFGYSDSRGDMMAQRGSVGFGLMGGTGGGSGGGFDGSAFGSAKMRQTRDSAFSGSGWGAGQRSPRRSRAAGGRGFSRRQDSSSSASGSMGGGSGRGGGQGHSPAGRGKLPSLLAHRMYPDSGAFQSQRGPQDFPARNFGGGPRANRQHGRKRPLNRVSTARSLRGAGLRDQRSPLHIGSSQAHSFPRGEATPV